VDNNSLKHWQGTLCVIGVDFGDSGKGRMIDDLASRAQIVARYGGGSNTGHTVKNEYGKFAMHIMPSGIFNGRATCLIGRNVACNLESLTKEMKALQDAGVSYKNLVIDKQASMTMPWHILRDSLREKISKSKIGTTLNGVGPTYADRIERVGLKINDLMSNDFEEKLYWEVAVQNKFYRLKLNAKDIHHKYLKFREIIKPYVGNTVSVLKQAQKSGKNILFEGAQGTLLDVDFGTYPYVTSSNPGVLGIWRSFDLHPSELNYIIGITKAYTTRVGEGPMPTKIKGKDADFLVEKGNEYGTTTGRRRDVGWLDLVLVKAAACFNKVTGLAITKLDVLTGLKKIKICTAYKINGKKVDYLSGDAKFLSKCQPVYEELPGWSQDITKIRNFSKLPKNARSYVKQIEKTIKIPVKFISVGPGRGEVIYR